MAIKFSIDLLRRAGTSAGICGGGGVSTTNFPKGINSSFNFGKNCPPNMNPGDFTKASQEGSGDRRGTREGGTQDYASWNSYAQNYSERAAIFTHTVENPYVDAVSFKLFVTALWDSQKEALGDTKNPTRNAGEQKPAVVNIAVETGFTLPNGEQYKISTSQFVIQSLINTPTTIEIGNPGVSKSHMSSLLGQSPCRTKWDLPYELSRLTSTSKIFGARNEPFFLHLPVDVDQSVNYESRIPGKTDFIETTKVKRYITVFKLSTETNSSAVKKNVRLTGVTEYTGYYTGYDNFKFNFASEYWGYRSSIRQSYPHAAIAGIKLDSRQFSTIPSRQYHVKMKRVKIPSNCKYYGWHPDANGVESVSRDMRYWESSIEAQQVAKEKRQIYKGDWDGGFYYAWTDNPAWIIYDLLTDARYGLGNLLDKKLINHWDLYKIGRWCDAVDDEGYFVGVGDGQGGLEPRYSCNIIFNDPKSVFDAINLISSLYRGFVYFQNNRIEFSDDRPKEPVAFFNNLSVNKGGFIYSSLKLEERFNTIEAVFLDKKNMFKTSMEFVEDVKDVQKRGPIKKTVNFSGITSRAQTRRAARHILYSTLQEDQTVSFETGYEALLCRPGDLIVIDDELKNENVSYGKVLETNQEEGWVRVSKKFPDGYGLKTSNKASIQLYKPSPYGYNEGDVAQRARYTNFEILQYNDLGWNFPPALATADVEELKVRWHSFIGRWRFDKYTAGYSGKFDLRGKPLPNAQDRYPSWVREGGGASIFWSLEGKGWVLSEGVGPLDESLNQYIIPYENIDGAEKIITNICSQGGGIPLYLYNKNNFQKRGELVSNGFKVISETVAELNYGYREGANTKDIMSGSNKQVINLDVVSWGLLESGEYGDRIYIDKKDPLFSLLQFVPDGSTYRLKTETKEEALYKIVTIKENQENEYQIVATKYYINKYKEIEELEG